ncbi:LamB/YcsF family protein [Microbacterium sp. YJN-G]|uniref:LamB/YcsF family protein n=1 Tax=Microbacterium sp. YJN-G TaxID=2763257 RepID=UPI001877D07F|nr:5-oxoprolinase subunit PxpA [Microbacterium sp. YJN-G]
MAITVDLVADMGESFGAYTMGDDDALLDIVSSANIACGFHAGDPRVMDRTVGECRARGVGIGAHPSFPDLVGFGRRTMELEPDEVRTDILYQLGALSAFAQAHGTRVTHLCPHGRLGNLVITRPDYARAMAEAVHGFDPRIILFTQAGEVVPVAEELGLRIAMVGAVDRSYEDDGTLTPRTIPGAVLHDPDEIASRTVRMVTEGTIVSRGGVELPISCDTVLLHGDGPDAVALARRIRAELEGAGVTIAPIHETLGS